MMYTQVQDAATMLEDEVIASIVIASSLINNGERTSIKAKEKLNDPETTRKKLEVSALSTRDESFDLSLGEKKQPPPTEKAIDESTAVNHTEGSNVPVRTENAPAVILVTSDCSLPASLIEQHKAPCEQESNISASNTNE